MPSNFCLLEVLLLTRRHTPAILLYVGVVHMMQILTKDSVTVFVDAVVYYKIFDPIISTTNIRDAGWGTRLLAQTMLRDILGAYSLQDTMTSKDLLSNQLKVLLSSTCCICVYILFVYCFLAIVSSSYNFFSYFANILFIPSLSPIIRMSWIRLLIPGEWKWNVWKCM